MDPALVDLDVYLADPTSAAAKAEAERAAESLILTGALVVRDSRAPKEANDRFLDLFEDYFAQPDDVLRVDERPELGYQVGVTLENTEKPKCGRDDECQAVIAALDPAERPLDLSGHSADPKCRFFHRMTEKPPYESKFPYSTAPNVVPAAMEGWETRVDEWGSHIKQAVEGVARMVAAGLGLEERIFLDAGRYGSHLLAPTATDLDKYGELNSIYAGFHTDLNFLTIHGQSRYPGCKSFEGQADIVNIWARNTGKRIPAKVPEGCLLVQAGKQLEWLSGGLIKAGFHEVICNEATLAALERRKASHPDRPRIRISSTFFWHLTPDFHLEPMPELKARAEKRFGSQKDYGAMLVGDQVRQELGLIALMS
ncbi:unnamed protein product [Cutaneotrichosporon oleaginosum]